LIFLCGSGKKVVETQKNLIKKEEIIIIIIIRGKTILLAVRRQSVTIWSRLRGVKKYTLGL